MCVESLHVPLLYLCFWVENRVKTRPEITPSIFCYFCRSRMSRVRVSHACASLVIFAFHACASGMRTRRLAKLYSMRTRQVRARVTVKISRSRECVSYACASMLAGCLLYFLCSFHFCKLPLHPLSHSCPIKPENT